MVLSTKKRMILAT